MADWGLSEVARLTDRIAGAGLKATAALLTKVFGERSPADHERWDQETRQNAQKKAIEALAG